MSGLSSANPMTLPTVSSAYPGFALGPALNLPASAGLDIHAAHAAAAAAASGMGMPPGLGLNPTSAHGNGSADKNSDNGTEH